MAISWQRVERLRSSEPITIGRPDPNAHCYIVTPQQQKGPLAVEGAACLAPVGVPGELLISGPRLARGYAKCLDQTAAAFVPNPCYSLVEASLPEGLRQYYRTAYRTGGNSRAACRPVIWKQELVDRDILSVMDSLCTMGGWQPASLLNRGYRNQGSPWLHACR